MRHRDPVYAIIQQPVFSGRVLFLIRKRSRREQCVHLPDPSLKLTKAGPADLRQPYRRSRTSPRTHSDRMNPALIDQHLVMPVQISVGQSQCLPNTRETRRRLTQVKSEQDGHPGRMTHTAVQVE